MDEAKKIDSIFNSLGLAIEYDSSSGCVYLLDEHRQFTHFESNLMPVAGFGLERCKNISPFNLKHEILMALSKRQSVILFGCSDQGRTYRKRIQFPKAKSIDELYMKLLLRGYNIFTYERPLPI
jgi:hypothetical protein